jgi:gluconate 5-dehydrogenase
VEAAFSVKGRTAIVTGGSYGLGTAFAEVLSEAGANVVVAARSQDRLEQVAKQLEAAGGTAMAHACDIADPASVTALVDAVWERFGSIDIMVNNAGVAAEAGMMPERVPDDLFAQTVQVNLTGTFYCCREVARRLLAAGRPGSIINIASVAGLGGLQNFPVAYQATKAAVINMTRNLACSWADRGIRVNAIAPGWFPSEMTNLWFAVEPLYERFRSQAPMGRVGELRELAGPLLFLASDASSFVTGQILAVDGGASAALGNVPYTDELFAIHAAAVPELGERILPS